MILTAAIVSRVSARVADEWGSPLKEDAPDLTECRQSGWESRLWRFRPPMMSRFDPSGGRNVQQRRLLANEIACQLIAIDGAQDFDPFCAVIKAIQHSILNEWSHEERRQPGDDGDDHDQVTPITTE